MQLYLMKKKNHSNTKNDKNINELLKILICPKTGSSLKYNKETQELISLKAKLAYPIRNNIPILVEKEARKLNKS